MDFTMQTNITEKGNFCCLSSLILFISFQNRKFWLAWSCSEKTSRHSVFLGSDKLVFLQTRQTHLSIADNNVVCVSSQEANGTYFFLIQILQASKVRQELRENARMFRQSCSSYYSLNVFSRVISKDKSVRLELYAHFCTEI